jgi:ankyrin repeat protein
MILERTTEGINDVDMWGNSPIMHAISIGALGALPLLIEAGADHTARNSTGETAWDIAVRRLKMDDPPPPEDRETYLVTIADWAHKMTLAQGYLTCGSR